MHLLRYIGIARPVRRRARAPRHRPRRARRRMLSIDYDEVLRERMIVSTRHA
jgi:hypothetical protein